MVTIINTDSVGAGVRLTIVPGETAIIAEGTVVGSTDNFGVRGAGSNINLTIAGSVHAPSSFGAIFTGGSPGSDVLTRIVVTESGQISGGVFIRASDSDMRNHGTITLNSSTLPALYLEGVGSAESEVFNTGTIDGSGIAVGRVGNEAFTLINTGLIRGGTFAFWNYIDASQDTILNRGTMFGDVNLGDGNDLFDGRGGRVEGDVLGGNGDDMFIAGQSEERFDGGAGLDTLDLSHTNGSVVSLSNDVIGSDVISGDFYTGIENVTGSRLGVDRITGSGAANNLKGNGGADVLRGMAGNDTLIGGGGKDALAGGQGADRFLFTSAAEGGDRISDFTRADDFQIDASGFGGGLTPGALAASKFRARADNQAQDANDRFIFRTTDKTLWFDANGSAAGGLKMIADLQANAVVTAADILLV